MNERIKKLKEQAGAVVYTEQTRSGDVVEFTDYSCFDSEKFAELIVRECVEVLRLVPCCADDKPDFGDEVVFQEAVLKHFGVEE